jgi:competence protein ComEA
LPVNQRFYPTFRKEFKMNKWLSVILLFPVLAVAEPVDINKADAETISKNLKGIGPKKAQAIVQYRQEHGPFKSLQDVDKVSGIGQKTMQANEKDIVISDVAVDSSAAQPAAAPTPASGQAPAAAPQAAPKTK